MIDEEANDRTNEENVIHPADVDDASRRNGSPGIIREVIEKKPDNRYQKKIIGLLLVLVLIAGSTLGFVTGTYLAGRSGETGNTQQNAGYVIDKTVSPVVPISEKVLPSIVAIKVKATVTTFFGSQMESQGTGSGIIYDSQGHIVTNNHVVENASDLVVVLNDGTELPAQVVGRDALSDLAVVKVDGKDLQAAEFGDSSKLQVGELAVALGSPMGTDFAGSVTAGIISGLNRQVSVGEKTMQLIQTDAAINPGNSGGALVNSQGQVIGINTVKLAESAVEGMGFAIPVNEAKPIIEQLISDKKVIRPSLGITGSTITEEDASTYGIPQGVYVHDVSAYGAAERAGLKQGDIITAMDGKKILTIDELVEAISGHKVGDIVTVTVTDQFNKTKDIEVKLAERTADQ